ncbi:MAG TPA: OmpA family protein [Methylomirabilota bacterium]|jgi:peptidoglycan-associated lipoprotein|nr:OmpA family protein [Methylomirabilota bacterium]
MDLKILSTVLASLVIAATPAWTDAAPAKQTRTVVASASAPREMAPNLEGFAPTPDLRPVHFDFNRSAIRPGEARILDKNAEWLKVHSNVKVAIEGGADQRGSVSYNQNLSERRARAVKDYLVARGVSADRIVEVGDGEKLLACRAMGEVCWQKNRRADFLVKDIEKQSP